MSQHIVFIGIASGIGANDPGCRYAPVRVKQAITTQTEMDLEWHPVLHRRPGDNTSTELTELQERIMRRVVPIVTRGSRFVAVDGDHSSAMGIWQGAMEALHPNQRFGLLWLDAHPDLHSFTSSRTGNAHGMPLAALLGQGDTQLTQIYGSGPTLDPANLVLLGLRHWEPQEMVLIQRLKLHTYDMRAITRSGSFNRVFQTALEHLRSRCDCYGVSVDLDVIAPRDVPGVGSPVAAGLAAETLIQALRGLSEDRRFLGLEIAEYNPLLDRRQLTLRCILELVSSVFGDAVKPNRFLGSASAGSRSSSRPIPNSAARR